MKTSIKILAVITLVAVLTGCVDNWDCDKKIKKEVAALGIPSDITRYKSDGYNSQTYYWYDAGVSKTFTWSDDSECEISTYTFIPW